MSEAVTSRLGESEAAAYLGITRSTLASFARGGRGPVFYQIGKTRQYEPDALRTWLSEQRKGHPAAAKVAALRKLAHDWLDDVRDNQPSDSMTTFHQCASAVLAITDS